MTDVVITMSPSRLRHLLKETYEDGFESGTHASHLNPAQTQVYLDKQIGLILYGDSWFDRVPQ